MRNFGRNLLRLLKRPYDLAPQSHQDPVYVDESGFRTTLAREFRVGLKSRLGIEAHPEDAGDIFYEGMGEIEPTYAILKNVGDDVVSKITAQARDYYEDARIQDDIIGGVIKATLWHWTTKDERENV